MNKIEWLLKKKSKGSAWVELIGVSGGLCSFGDSFFENPPKSMCKTLVCRVFTMGSHIVEYQGHYQQNYRPGKNRG